MRRRRLTREALVMAGLAGWAWDTSEALRTLGMNNTLIELATQLLEYLW